MLDNPWYGVVSRVNFVPGGASDPSLIYRGYEFNYWDVEDAIFDMCRDDLGGDPSDMDWIDWLRDNADEVRGYLDDWIFHGAPLTWKN